MTEADVAAGPVVELGPGLRYYPGHLCRNRQLALLAEVRATIVQAPLFQPTMPRTGTPFSVRMTNCGSLGWTADRAGYHYVERHPQTRRAWPAIPRTALESWQALAAYPRQPDACLINFYAAGARMGLHQDKDEEGFLAPVVSLSLGDTCTFRFGGTDRRGPTGAVKLQSGDALVLAGPARLAFHGVDRILAGSSRLLAEGGRFNLTLRRVAAEPRDDPA